MYKIGVDIDGVLANFTSSARRICQKWFDGRPSDDLIQTGWGFDSLGITPEEEKWMWKAIDNEENWWENLSRLNHTWLLPELARDHHVIFITNRKDGTGKPVEKQSAQWLFDEYRIKYPTVLLSNDKGPLVKALKLDYYIDDRDKNVREVLQAAPECKTYMCKWPWKPAFQEGFPRAVNNFDEFAKIIQEA